jgi:hypothetical protein
MIDAGLTLEDGQSGLTLRRLGIRPGDVVEVVGVREHAAIRIAGGPADLYLPAEELASRDGSVTS